MRSFPPCTMRAHDRGWVCPTAQRQIHLWCRVAFFVESNRIALQCEVMPMNMHVEVKEATSLPKPMKISLLRRIFNFLVRLLSSPKGDQGGWEGGARGL